VVGSVDDDPDDTRGLGLGPHRQHGDKTQPDAAREHPIQHSGTISPSWVTRGGRTGISGQRSWSAGHHGSEGCTLAVASVAMTATALSRGLAQSRAWCRRETPHVRHDSRRGR
jgi:hypothetical protein